MNQTVMETSIQEFIRSRVSVRDFLPTPVPREVLESILETATRAPSAHNRQPWRFVILTNQEDKSRLAQEMGNAFQRDLYGDGVPGDEVERIVARSRRRVESAPVVILLCLDASLGDHYPDERRQQAEYTMGVQSVALAGGNLLLAAHAAGLGGVWICAPLFAPQAVRTALSLPDEWHPQGLILLGYPCRLPSARTRRPLSEVSVFL